MSESARPRQFSLSALIIAVLLIGALLGLVVFIASRSPHAYGPVESREDWPLPLTELLNKPPAPIAIDPIRVFRLGDGVGFDPEYVWRMDDANGLLDHLVSRWGLTQTPGPNHDVFHGRSRMHHTPVPDWWQPSQHADVNYFICPNAAVNSKSNQFRVAYSKSARAIYVYHYFNF